MSGPISINIPTTEAQTSVPQIAAGSLAQLRLVGITPTQNEKGSLLKWEYALVEPVAKQGGGEIKPGDFGSKIFENISLYGKDTPAGEIPTWAVQRIAVRQDGLLGTGDPGNSKNKPARPAFTSELIPQLIGLTLIAKFRARKDDPNQTEIGDVFYPGDVAK